MYTILLFTPTARTEKPYEGTNIPKWEQHDVMQWNAVDMNVLVCV